MALTKIYIRYWNPPSGRIIGDPTGILNGLKKRINGGYTPTLEIYWAGLSEALEMGGTATAVLNGTTTPLQLSVDCAQNTDIDTTGGHVRKIAVIGLSIPPSGMGGYALGASSSDYVAPRLTVELIALNGTTVVESVNYYTRLIHAYACQWGTAGADASGDITVESPATTVKLTITDTENESSGGILYFPADMEVEVMHTRMNIYAKPTAPGDGFSVTITQDGFEGEGGTDPDFDYTAVIVGYSPQWHDNHFMRGSRFTQLDAQMLYTLANINAAVTGSFQQFLSVKELT